MPFRMTNGSRRRFSTNMAHPASVDQTRKRIVWRDRAAGGCESGKSGSQVDLDELIAVAERCDAQQSAGCRESRADARAGETVPHARQHAGIVADHVDHRPNDVLGARPRCRECLGRVGDDLVDLVEEIAASDETPVAVKRALPGKHRKPAGINDRDVGVARGPVQPLRVESSDGHPASLHSALTQARPGVGHRSLRYRAHTESRMLPAFGR